MTPDLKATFFDITQQSASAGSSVQLLFDWQNTSDATLENVQVDFYLSSNFFISTNDFLLSSFTIDSLEAGAQTGPIAITVDLPEADAEIWNAIGNGAYYIGTIPQGESEAFPVTRGVNEDVIRVDIPELADLTAKSFEVTSVGSDTLEFTFNIANIAQGNSGNFEVDFYLSSNDYISTDDYFLGSFDIADVAGRSETGEITVSFDLPAEDAELFQIDNDGVFAAGIIIDEAGLVNETNVNNNSNQGQQIDSQLIRLDRGALPNLQTILFDVVEDGSFSPGQQITTNFALANPTSSPVTEDFEVSFFLSTNSFISTDDTLLGSVTVPGGTLDAFDIVELQQILDLPELEEFDFDSGRQFVGAIVDSGNVIAESVESDNSNRGQLLDSDGEGQFLDNFRASIPDLTLLSFDVLSDEAAVSGTVDIEFNVANISQGSSDPFSVSFFISDNDFISTNDFLLGTYEVSEGLAGGISSTGIISQTFTLPDISEEFWRFIGDGTYRIGAIVDAADEVDEYLEGNNSNLGVGIDTDIVFVDEVPFADLVSESFAVVPDFEVEAGEEVTIEFSVANHRSTAAGSFEVEVYLSNNDFISTNDLLVGTVDVSGLAGDSSTGIIQTTITLPDANDPFWDQPIFGTPHLGILIDPDNEVTEFSQLNNNNQGQGIDNEAIDLILEADLFGTSFNVVPEGTLISGEDFEVTYEVSNQGTVAAEFSATNFFLLSEEYFNNNSAISPEDTNDPDSGLIFLFGDTTSNSLDIPGRTSTGELSIELSLPDDLATGTYFVGALHDQFNEIAESNEFNNSLTGEFLDFEEVFIAGNDVL